MLSPAQSAGVPDSNVITRLTPRPTGLSVGGRRLRQSDGQPLLVSTQIASPNPGVTQATLQHSLDSGNLGNQLKQLGWSIAPSVPARVGVRCSACVYPCVYPAAHRAEST